MIVLDTETTGRGENERVIQLGAAIVKLNPSEPYPSNIFIEKALNEYFCLDGKDISYGAMAVHHITPEMLLGKPKFKESDIYKELSKLGNEIVIGHNVNFDLKWLDNEGLKFNGMIIDTLKCAKHLVPNVEKYSLQYLRYALGLYKQEKRSISSHNALGDVYVTINLLAYLLNKVDNKVASLINLTSKPVLEHICHFKKYKGLTWEEVADKDIQYLEWLRDNVQDMSEDLKYTLNYYLNKSDSMDLPF